MDYNKTIVIIIPAYEPNNKFYEFVSDLRNNGIKQVVVVDDGSGEGYAGIFQKINDMDGTVVLKHAVNLGKGRSLKDAFNYVLNEVPNLYGVVTADSDGQHKGSDIRKVIDMMRENSNSLVLGCRRFDREDIPWKSKFGNEITKKVFSFLCGIKVTDTQTGLRGIPKSFLYKLISAPGERFEYETNMILTAKNEGVRIIEIPIETIYDSKENHKTHFHPFRDSVMIYKTILRYSISSLLSVLVDYSIFYFAISLGRNIYQAMACGRAGSLLINFLLNRNLVFKEKQGNILKQLAGYLVLVIISGGVSAVLIDKLNSALSISIMISKVIVETVIFFFNYYIQGALIFKNE